MFYKECYKLLIKQKLIIILLAFFILKIIITFMSGYISENAIERNQQGYLKYINKYQGKVTEEKSKMIDKENSMFSICHQKINDLNFKKSKQQISDSEYRNQIIEYAERAKNNKVFQVFYNQYFYAKDKPNERYIIDERGWTTILASSNPDYLLIFCLIVTLTPIFCYEYESDMYNLVISTKKGKYKIASIKILVGCFMVLLINVMFSFAECLVINFMVGLNNLSYPIQSLKCFENCMYDMTIIKTYMFFIAFRIVGSIMMLGYISVISIIYKKTNTTIFFGTLIIILPFVVVKNKLALLNIPIPAGLFLGNKFLSNIQDNSNFIIKILHKYISNKKNVYEFYLIFNFIVNILLCTIFLYVSKMIYSKKSIKVKRKLKEINSNYLLFIMVPMLCLLVGCSNHNEEDVCPNVSLEQSSKYGETDRYKVDFDICNMKITATDKETNEKIDLLNDAIENKAIICGIFVKNNWCYYLEKQNNKAGFRIYGIKLSDFRKQLIYNSVSENIEDHFGIVTHKTEKDVQDMMNIYGGFFLNNKYIYYFDDFNCLYQINRSTSKEKLIANDVYCSVYSCFYNNDIYYMDTQARLCCYSSEDNSAKPIKEIYTNKFRIENDKLIYRDLLDENKWKSTDIE